MKKQAKFKSKHNLDFMVADYKSPIDDGRKWYHFSVGTCHGLFGHFKDSYEILAVSNHEMNNGHFDDVLEWFENSCKRDNYTLKFLFVFNERLIKHLVEKRGFELLGDLNIEKSFNK